MTCHTQKRSIYTKQSPELEVVYTYSIKIVATHMITRLVVMGGGSREVLLLKLLDMTRSTHFGIFGLVTVASGVSRLPQGYTYSYSS